MLLYIQNTPYIMIHSERNELRNEFDSVASAYGTKGLYIKNPNEDPRIYQNYGSIHGVWYAGRSRGLIERKQELSISTTKLKSNNNPVTALTKGSAGKAKSTVIKAKR